jgi:hypothetical protein
VGDLVDLGPEDHDLRLGSGAWNRRGTMESAVCFVIFFFFWFCGDRELRETKRKVDREEIKNRSRGELDERGRGFNFFKEVLVQQ